MSNPALRKERALHYASSEFIEKSRDVVRSNLIKRLGLKDPYKGKQNGES